jgi:hypothetical protein
VINTVTIQPHHHQVIFLIVQNNTSTYANSHLQNFIA